MELRATPPDAGSVTRSASGAHRSVLDGMVDAYVAVDHGWRITHVDAATALRHAPSTDALVGLDAWTVWPAAPGTRCERELHAAMADRLPRTFVERYPTAAGEQWVEVRAYPSPAGLSVFFRDVTLDHAADAERGRWHEAQEILAAASAVLGRSLDPRETANAVARAAIPRFADCAIVDGFDADGRIARLALAHADPAAQASAEAMERRWPPEFERHGAWRRVLHTGEPLVLADIDPDAYAPLAIDAEHLVSWQAFRARSCIAVPLTAARERLGMLAFFRVGDHRRYTDADLPLALELGRRGAVALLNARLFTRERRAHAATDQARDRTERLQRLSAELTRSQTPAAVIDVVVRHLVLALGAKASGVYELSADARELRMLGSEGLAPRARERLARVPVEVPLPIGEVARTRAAVLVEDCTVWKASHPGAPLPPGDDVIAIAALPLLVEERLLGALTVTLPGPRAFSDEERGFLQAFADLCAQALERARLFDAERGARAALAESERQFRVLADAIPTLAWTARADGYTDWYNARWYEYTGVPPEDAIGWGWRSVHDPRELPRVQAEWEATLADVRDFEMVFPLRRRDGVFRQFLTRMVALRDEHGTVMRWFGTSTDIESERARAAAEAAQAAAEAAQAVAEAASRAKDELLAVVSHELRAPLAPARALAQVLARADAPPHDVREIAGEIERHIAYEARLIEDLLEYERVGRGMVTLQPAACDVHEVARLALRGAAPVFESYGVPIVDAFAATAPVAWADPVRVQQILYNLLLNAAKFSPHGAAVIVRSRNPWPGWVDLAVADTGIGLAPEELARIFEPFTRVGTPEESRAGLGLGLAHSRRLAELQGGTLTATSDGTGRGATFTLRLPTARPTGVPAPASPPAADGAPASERALHVLVVEDDAAAARALGRLLGLHGHVVHRADCLAAAERVARAEPLDVLLCDLHLGLETGLDGPRRVATAAREGGHTPPPAIVLSGYDRESDIAESRAAGFVAHLAKPVDAETLLEALRAVARRER